MPTRTLACPRARGPRWPTILPAALALLASLWLEAGAAAAEPEPAGESDDGVRLVVELRTADPTVAERSAPQPAIGSSAETPFAVRLVLEPIGHRSDAGQSGNSTAVDSTAVDSSAGESPTFEVRTLDARAPGGVELRLPRNSFWQLRVEAESHWAAARTIAAESRIEKVDLVPTAPVAARIGFAPESAPPDDLERIELRFTAVAAEDRAPVLRQDVGPAPDEASAAPRQVAGAALPPPPASSGNHRPAGGTISCLLSAAAPDAAGPADAAAAATDTATDIELGAECRLPLGRWDLRFQAPGFAATYLWDVRVAKAGLDVGRLVLGAGATVVGRLARVSGEPVPQPARVALEPDAARPSGTAEPRLRLRRLSAETTPSGRFVVADAAPGVYWIVATAPGLAETRSGPLRLAPGDAAELDDPVLLYPPLRLRGVVRPALDPFGDPWRVSWLALADVSSNGARGVDAEGAWQSPELDPGEYLVSVRGGPGSPEQRQLVRLDPFSPPLELEIDTVPVEGIVTLGDEPVPGTAYFGGRHGMTSIEMEVDEEGTFLGLLPREGTWEIDLVAPGLDLHRRLRRVEVERGPGGVARLHLELPDTRIEGRVVDVEDLPVAGAQVLASGHSTGERPSIGRTDDDGQFLFRGLEAGQYTLQARASGNRQSDPLAGSFEEDRPWTGVRLVARSAEAWRGRVIDRETGLPVAGALVLPRVGGQGVSTIAQQTSTDLEGRFELRLPSNLARVGAAILARGYEPRLASFDVDQRGRDRPELEIALSVPKGTSILVPFAPGRSIAELAESGGAYPLLLDGAGREYDIQLLRQWVRLHPEPGPPAGLRVRHLPPDVYTLCWIDAGRSAAASNQSEAEAAELGCETQSLGPGSEIVFRPHDGAPIDPEMAPSLPSRRNDP